MLPDGAWPRGPIVSRLSRRALKPITLYYLDEPAARFLLFGSLAQLRIAEKPDSKLVSELEVRFVANDLKRPWRSISPDGSLMAAVESSSTRAKVRVWEAHTGKELTAIDAPEATDSP